MGARILIIEDNPTNLELLKFLLEAHGHKIVYATDGDDGLRLAEQSGPDLIICDLHLPRFDGFQVAEQVKARRDLRGIPLIAVTAFAMPADRERALSAGYDGYFAKPIDPESFVGDLEQYLPRSMRSDGLQQQGDEHSKDHAEQLPDVVTRSFQDDSTPKKKCGTILVVDDSSTNRELVQLILESSGYRVILADGPTKAIEVASTRQVDLILTDMHMPQRNGMDLLQSMRTPSGTQRIPVLMFSSTSSGPVDSQQAIAMGAAGFITRPIEPQQLVAEIQQCLRRVAHQTPGAD